MKKNIFLGLVLASAISFSSCSQKYEASSITATSIDIDGSFDSMANAEILDMVNSYKMQIDTVMQRQLATAPVTMTSGKPQSLLANFTSDVLREVGSRYVDGDVSLAIMNNGGLRAPINEGVVTVGDVFKVFPFENELVILKVKGSDIKELFKRLAARGGEGLSGCELVAQDNKVVSLKLDGREVEDDKIYSVATIDYLAEGNSGMSVLLNAVETVVPGVLLRDAMIDYIENLGRNNQQVKSVIDNRVIIKKK